MRAEHDRARRLVRYTRTSAAFRDLSELEEVYSALIRAAQGLDQRRLGLLIDLREAPARNDPGFEEAIGRHRKAMMRGYGRVALLVKTAVGKLQVGRHTREDGVAGLVTQDETEALRFLSGE
jgi:hypothetical protein